MLSIITLVYLFRGKWAGLAAQPLCCRGGKLERESQGKDHNPPPHTKTHTHSHIFTHRIRMENHIYTHHRLCPNPNSPISLSLLNCFDSPLSPIPVSSVQSLSYYRLPPRFAIFHKVRGSCFLGKFSIFFGFGPITCLFLFI